MKNRIFSLALMLGALGTLTISGCTKYDDGPGISLRSRSGRVANTWRVDNYKINGTDYTSLLTNYTETFTESGGYSYAWGSANGTGNWEFQNEDSEIKLTGTNNQANHTLVILKLEEKQFWYYYMDGADRKEFHMIED